MQFTLKLPSGAFLRWNGRQRPGPARGRGPAPGSTGRGRPSAGRKISLPASAGGEAAQRPGSERDSPQAGGHRDTQRDRQGRRGEHDGGDCCDIQDEDEGDDGAAGRLVRTYSGGMRRRLDVAASLLAAPPVLFLDEPTTGLDPYGRLALWQVLADLTARGTSLLLTTQYIEEAERLARLIVIIDRGTVIASGTPGQLKAQAGGDRLEVQSPPGQDPQRLAGALSALGTGEPAIDEAAGRVVLPVADGPAILPQVAARLAAAGLRVSGLALRRPTLEEAFPPSPAAHPAGRGLRRTTPAARPLIQPSQLTKRGARHDRRRQHCRPAGPACPGASGYRHHHRAEPAPAGTGTHPAGIRHAAVHAGRAPG